MFDKNKSICVLGMGYIGLPTATLFAMKDLQVYGCDINANIVNTINQGKIHIVENDLEKIVQAVVLNQKLIAFTEPQKANVYIIAVPTPLDNQNNPDLSYIKAATQSIAPLIEAGCLIILESTSPVGTTEKIAQWLSELRPDLNIPSLNHSIDKNDPNRIFIAYCPERVLPGRVLIELIDNDRIIGGLDAESSEYAKQVYECFVQGKIFLSDARTAELSKLVENAFRDVNIAFANELSMICDALNINVWHLIQLANRHPRVQILQPGPGVGGHCIAVDPWFIVHTTPEHSQLIRNAREVNHQKPQYVVQQVITEAKNYKQPRIACLGLSFKADIDDLRESPALTIVLELAQKQIGKLLVVEPYIHQLPPSLAFFQPEVSLVSLHEAMVHADIILVLVDHKLFLEIDTGLLEGKTVINTRGIWQK